MIYIAIIFQVFNPSRQSQNPVFGPHGELLMESCVLMSTVFDQHSDSFKEFSLHNPNHTDNVPDFRPSVQIDDSTLFWCRGPFLHVLEDNSIYAILQSGPASGYPRYIRFTSSQDTGKTWLKPNVIIRHDPDIIIAYPSMTVRPDGSINVVWVEPYDNGVLFSRSLDGGLTWSDAVRVDDGIPANHRQDCPDLTCSGDTLFVSWIEGSTSWYPCVKMSTDAGETWINETQITCVPINSHRGYFRPYIRYDAQINRWYVLWESNNGEVYVARSSDGITWQASIATIDNIEDAHYPSMALGQDGTLHVVWGEARFAQFDTDIFLTKSTDGGVSWSNSVLVNDRAGIGANQYEPHISVDPKGVIHVGWIECFPFASMTNAYYTLSADSGATWLEPNLTVTDIPYTIAPGVPYTLFIASDTASYAYAGWTYEFNGVDPRWFNFFTTNCPDTPGIEENKITSPVLINLEVFPNPFRDVIHIEYSLRLHRDRLELKIFDITGRSVKDFRHIINQSYNKVIWNGTDDANRKLPSGVYFLKLEAENYIETRKLILLR